MGGGSEGQGPDHGAPRAFPGQSIADRAAAVMISERRRNEQVRNGLGCRISRSLAVTLCEHAGRTVTLAQCQPNASAWAGRAVDVPLRSGSVPCDILDVRTVHE